MSNDVITSNDIQNKYQKLYKFLMKFLWDYQTVEALANLEIACYRSFPDKEDMQTYLQDLKYRIKNTYNELTEDDEPDFEAAFKMLERAIDKYDSENAQLVIENTVPISESQDIKVSDKREVFRFGDIKKEDNSKEDTSESEEFVNESEEGTSEPKDRLANPFDEE